MSIRQFDFRCWELSDPADDEHDKRHFETAAEVNSELADIREGNPDTKATAREMDAPCWVVEDDGECGQMIDQEDEGYVVHSATLAKAEELARAWGWVLVPGPGANEWLAYCPCGRPEDAPPPPPSPAELEAAGQLRLPGVPA